MIIQNFPYETNSVLQVHPITAASGHGGSEIFASVLLLLALIIVAVIAGRALAKLINQPSVLGELIVGVIIGNVGYYFNFPFNMLIMHLDEAVKLFNQTWLSGESLEAAASHIFTTSDATVSSRLQQIMTGPKGPSYVMMAIALWLLSNLGVILLLFMVGLESSVSEMVKVGGRALAVAIVGIAAPFGLGFIVSSALLPAASFAEHLFIGAALAATSVGITARVFKDLGKLNIAEAKVILGAAVIDDILGLIILAVVVGMVRTGSIEINSIFSLIGLSFAFLGFLMIAGEKLLRLLIPRLEGFDQSSYKLFIPLSICFALSWGASLIGLAAIIGAFAAGLILSESQFGSKHSARMHDLVAPLEYVLAPIFFVLMGMQVNLASFVSVDVLLLSAALIFVAILGKILSGTVAGKNLSGVTIGLGMVPRGEVGLIFASIGKGLGVIDGALFSAIVMMVVATTFITPFTLQWALKRQKSLS